MANTYSNTFIASRARIKTATDITGTNSGSVIFLKVKKALAPSTFAASKGDLESPSKPANNNKTMNGVHCQTSIKTIEYKALPGPKKS